MTYLEFYNKWIGKGVNIDYAYGAQCWDGVMQYMIELGYKAISCTTTGYVKDIWNNRKTNGILNYCNEVTIMQQGDIAVFKEVAGWTPSSHIAIFHSDIDGQYGWFFGQNQGGTAYPGGGACFNLVKLPYYATFDTAFRPKCFANNASTGNANTAIDIEPDQILTVGSVVSSVPMNIKAGIKTYSDGDYIRIPALGDGYFPLAYISEYDASDGKKDNYLANDKARVYVDQCSVEAIDIPTNRAKIHGIWVNATPLIEIRNGQ